MSKCHQFYSNISHISFRRPHKVSADRNLQKYTKNNVDVKKITTQHLLWNIVKFFAGQVFYGWQKQHRSLFTQFRTGRHRCRWKRIVISFNTRSFHNLPFYTAVHWRWRFSTCSTTKQTCVLTCAQSLPVEQTTDDLSPSSLVLCVGSDNRLSSGWNWMPDKGKVFRSSQLPLLHLYDPRPTTSNSIQSQKW